MIAQKEKGKAVAANRKESVVLILERLEGRSRWVNRK
jgi:hypothetical protein